MNGLSRRFWFAHHEALADLPLTARLHAAIAKAIAERYVDAAGIAMDTLVDDIERASPAGRSSDPGAVVAASCGGTAARRHRCGRVGRRGDPSVMLPGCRYRVMMQIGTRWRRALRAEFG